jgi:hypothetical protein
MTAITSDNRGHDDLWDIFWWFSSFILMQANVEDHVWFEDWWMVASLCDE